MTPRFPQNFADAVHLDLRMKERGVSWDDVVTVVRGPDKISMSYNGRSNYYGVVAERRIRVTMNNSTGEVFTVAIAEKG